jgi:hypothetical protein
MSGQELACGTDGPLISRVCKVRGHCRRWSEPGMILTEVQHLGGKRDPDQHVGHLGRQVDPLPRHEVMEALRLDIQLDILDIADQVDPVVRGSRYAAKDRSRILT